MSYKDTMTYQVNYARYKEAIKKWLEIYNQNEVKKLSRPYFETKVVKVKKENKGCDVEFICPICNEMLSHNNKKEPKGNWVNGENLDKIKFPCFCSYSDGEGSERKKGFLSMNNGYYYIGDITT